jgi:hypothetical protein
MNENVHCEPARAYRVNSIAAIDTADYTGSDTRGSEAGGANSVGRVDGAETASDRAETAGGGTGTVQFEEYIASGSYWIRGKVSDRGCARGNLIDGYGGWSAGNAGHGGMNRNGDCEPAETSRVPNIAAVVGGDECRP